MGIWGAVHFSGVNSDDVVQRVAAGVLFRGKVNNLLSGR